MGRYGEGSEGGRDVRGGAIRTLAMPPSHAPSHVVTLPSCVGGHWSSTYIINPAGTCTAVDGLPHSKGMGTPHTTGARGAGHAVRSRGRGVWRGGMYCTPGACTLNPRSVDTSSSELIMPLPGIIGGGEHSRCLRVERQFGVSKARTRACQLLSFLPRILGSRPDPG